MSRNALVHRNVNAQKSWPQCAELMETHMKMHAKLPAAIQILLVRENVPVKLANVQKSQYPVLVMELSSPFNVN